MTGLFFLATIPIGRPIIYYFARQFAAAGDGFLRKTTSARITATEPAAERRPPSSSEHQ